MEKGALSAQFPSPKSGEGCPQGGVGNRTKGSVMKRMYPLIVEGEEGNYNGYFPDLPGCATAGQTIGEMRENAKEALLLYLEEYGISGRPLPEASEAVRMEIIEIDQTEIRDFARTADPPLAQPVKESR